MNFHLLIHIRCLEYFRRYCKWRNGRSFANSFMSHYCKSHLWNRCHYNILWLILFMSRDNLVFKHWFTFKEICSLFFLDKDTISIHSSGSSFLKLYIFLSSFLVNKKSVYFVTCSSRVFVFTLFYVYYLFRKPLNETIIIQQEKNKRYARINVRIIFFIITFVLVEVRPLTYPELLLDHCLFLHC